MKYLLTLIAVCAIGFTASAQVNVNWNTISGLPSVVTKSANSNFTSTAINLSSGGLALLPYYKALSNHAGFTLIGNLSADGVNYTTDDPISVAFTTSGTTAVRSYTNLAASSFSNIKWLKFTSVTNNTTNGVYLTNIVWSYSR